MVPTLDIDLLWHTHMLDHEAYYTNSYQGVGCFLDHDDSIEEGLLSDGFTSAASHCEARFGVPFSTCPARVRGRVASRPSLSSFPFR